MTDNTFKFANAFGQTKPLYLKDVEKYEAEMDTPPAAPSSEVTPSPENPISKEEPADNTDWKKRHSDTKSYYDKKLNESTASFNALQQQNLELQNQLKEALNKPKSYPVSKEEIEAWADQFPDFYKTMDTIIAMRVDAGNETLRKELAELEKSQKAVAAEKGWAELLKLHPDANDLKDDPQFRAWFESQKPGVQALIRSADPYEISEGIDLYKVKMKIKPVVPTTPEKEASRAVTLNTKPETPKDKKVWKESEVHKMHPNKYAKLEAEIEQARAEGRFEYDITGY